MKPPQPQVVADLLSHLKEDMKRTGAELFCEDPIAAPTGSRVICTPPVLTTDDDWLIFVPEELEDVASNFLSAAGARTSDKQEHYPDGIIWWLGNLNLIVVNDHQIFSRWVHATYFANKMNLASKEERKEFFSALVDCRSLREDMIL